MAKWRKRLSRQLERNRVGRILLRIRRDIWMSRRILLDDGYYWPGFREPFNGQHDRLRAVRALIEQFEPDAFIETGTFVGSTTRFFCGNGIPVYTAEVKRAFWILARLRLGWGTEANAYHGDSRTMLERLAEETAFERPFAYLDAHWGENWSLQDEIELLCARWDAVLLVIDDFKVDDDPGYGGHMKALSLDTIALPAAAAAAFPATGSESETGAAHGTLYVAQGASARHALVRAIERGLLREAAATLVLS